MTVRAKHTRIASSAAASVALALAACSSNVMLRDASDITADVASDIEVSTSRDAFDAPGGIDATVDERPSDSGATDVIDERCPRSCASLGATCGTVRDPCVGVERCGGACVDALASVRVDVRHLGYDPVHDVLYAAVGERDPLHANSLSVIDPNTGIARLSLDVGSPLDAFAMSFGSPLFALGMPWHVSRFVADPPSLMWRAVHWTTPSAGHAHAVAFVPAGFLVAANTADGGPGCVVTTGAPMPHEPHTALEACPGSLVTGREGYAYGIAATTHGPELQVLQTSTSGTIATTQPFDAAVVHDTHATIALGRLYTTAGPVYDLADPALPRLVGRLPLAGGVAVDEAARMAFVLGTETVGGANALVWRVFDADSLELRFDDGTSTSIGPNAFVSEMVQTGPGRFAAVVYPDGADAGASLYLLRLPLRTPPLPTPDAGVDVARFDAGFETHSCWSPDGGPYDPNDPSAEAQRNVWALARAASRVLVDQLSGDAGLPSFWSAPRTPSSVPNACAADPPGAWETLEWSRIGFGFAPGETHRYSYQLDAIGSRTSAQFTARAVGDLDGDGTFSTFEVAGGLDGDGGVILGDLWMYRGLE